MKQRIENTSYEIYDNGTVINTRTGKALTPIPDNHGYLKVVLYVNGKAKQYYLHRLIAEAFLPKPSGTDLCVKHKDFNKANNDISNLQWEERNLVIKDAHTKDIYKNHLQSFKKRIMMVDKATMNTVKFDSVNQAAIYIFSINPEAKSVKATQANISQVLNKPGRTAYGCYWSEIM